MMIPQPCPISIIPAGYADIQLNISQRGDLPVNLQLFSRDGNHIAGKSLGANEISFEENKIGRKLLMRRKNLFASVRETSLFKQRKRLIQILRAGQLISMTT